MSYNRRGWLGLLILWALLLAFFVWVRAYEFVAIAVFMCLLSAWSLARNSAFTKRPE